MLDVTIISAILGLVTIAVWLYFSTEKIEARIDFDAFALPRTSFKTHLTRLPTKSRLLYRKINNFFINTIKTALYSGIVILPLVGIVIYLALTTSNNTCRIVFWGIGLLGIVVFIWWLPRSLLLLPYPKRRSIILACKNSRYELIDVPSRVIRYNGKAHIPLKVYEGDSYNISVDLHSSIREPLRNAPPMRFQRMKGDDDITINLNISRHNNQQEFLELEILAAGFVVEGDKKQKQALSKDTLRYQWNCFFENSGRHTFAIAFRVINDSDILEIGCIEQSVRVVKIDHLTQRQVWTWATIAGIISGGLAILEVLRTLGFW